MALEIERKFRLANDDWRPAVSKSTRIAQAFLLNDKDRAAVRVRIMGDTAFLTVKSANKGLTRIEVECEITVAEAEQLLGLCLPGTIEKTRHEVMVRDHKFEVDEFHGRNAGLIVAEIELDSEGEEFPRPGWLGAEVSHIRRYGNCDLAGYSYDEWTQEERDER